MIRSTWASCAQPATFETLSGGRPIMVLAPHPDDESLGCGGILAHAFDGPGAHVVCMTDGTRSHPHSASYPAARLAACRATELKTAVIALGGKPSDVTMLGLPDARMGRLVSSYDTIALRISTMARRFGAGVIFATSESDPHCDHVATAEIGRRAARIAGICCLFYPIWSRRADMRETIRFGQSYRLDPGPMRKRKRRAIAAHVSQLGRLIGDDPEGFVLPDAFVSMFIDTDEVFFEDPSQ